MNTLKTIPLILFLSFISVANAQQTGKVTGMVTVEDKPVEFAQILIASTSMGAVTDHQGKFTINNVPFGSYRIRASYIGYVDVTKELALTKNQPEILLDFKLTEQTMQLDNIVITGTKTYKRQTDSPVIVNVMNSVTLDNVQACNLSEGLRFQPGLRVETDCQTCNYTQLRMNGLAGGYSQILINGRPIFSPLTGLYGMDQLPANMIDRIEVVRGGGSSLYGSSAIGGTVNVITKIPKNNGFELNYTYHNIDSQTSDHTLSANATVISEQKNSGISLFLNRRERGLYDNNDDDFSEIALMKTTAVGTNMFFIPKDNQTLELNLSYIDE